LLKVFFTSADIHSYSRANHGVCRRQSAYDPY
jgi:hypothetical protein